MVLILLAGTAVYSNSFHVPFILDDDANIRLVAAKGLGELLLHGGARRFADITFALNYRLSGLQVAGYHATNLAIHLAAAVTLYSLCRSLLTALLPHRPAADAPPDEPVFIERYLPLAVALLFACHPLQTQAVTYLIQRYTSLAAFLYLLSVLAYVRARLCSDRSGKQRAARSWGCLSLLAALLAFGTKQITYTLPFMLILLEYCIFGGRLLSRRFLCACGTALAMLAALLLYQRHAGTLGGFLFDLRQMASEDRFTSRITYFLTQLRVVATYLRLVCLPTGQNLLYDYPVYRSFLSLPVLSATALHLGALSSAVIFFRMSKRGHSPPDSPRETALCLAAVGIFWFYLALAVESSVIPITDVIFEHRMYLPSAGLFITVCALVTIPVHRWRAGAAAAWIGLAAAVIVLGGMTIARNRVWSDPLRLWQDTVEKSPNRGLALANLAAEYLERHRPDTALPLFVRAIELTPNIDNRTVIGLGIALQEMGVSDMRSTTGQELMVPQGALGAASLDYGRISDWEAVRHNNIGLAYEILGDTARARKAYELAVYFRPAYGRGWYNLGLLAARLDDTAGLARATDQLKTHDPPLAAALTEKSRH